MQPLLISKERYQLQWHLSALADTRSGALGLHWLYLVDLVYLKSGTHEAVQKREAI